MEDSGDVETLFEEIGEARLRSIVDTFVDRMARDMMIGFFFRGVDLDRLKELEYQFAGRHLGAPAPYEGRPLQAAHARHPILGGQFDRRLKILSDVIDAHGVPERVRDEWLLHVRELRPLVTRDATGECNTDEAARRALDAAERAQRRALAPRAPASKDRS